MSDTPLETLTRSIAQALQARGEMLATAESCTGGSVAAALTELPGSSAWFERGFVTYANAAKIDLLGVSPATLTEHGAVSEATARAMAEGALQHSPADWSLAITGIAGPGGGSDDKPVGTVWFAWSWRHGATTSARHCFAGTRSAVRQQAVITALETLRQRLGSQGLLA